MKERLEESMGKKKEVEGDKERMVGRYERKTGTKCGKVERVRKNKRGWWTENAGNVEESVWRQKC